MENFNTVPDKGTFGGSVEVINQNFLLAQQEMEMLRQIYNSLSQSQPIPVTTLPATGEAGKIYRLVGTNSYADYMYAESDLTTPIKMAEYDNAIDDEPTAGSDNLVKSGGVAASVVFDISAYHATGGTLATYADLAEALSGTNVPTSVRKGGMSVKFVQTSDNKYVQFRYMSSSTAVADFTNTANWQGVDKQPTPNSQSLVESGGVDSALNYRASSGTILYNNSVDSAKVFIEAFKGHTYRILLEDITVFDDVTFKLGIFVKYANLGSVTTLFDSRTSAIKDNYTFTLLSTNGNVEYLEIAARVENGKELKYTVEDITQVGSDIYNEQFFCGYKIDPRNSNAVTLRDVVKNITVECIGTPDLSKLYSDGFPKKIFFVNYAQTNAVGVDGKRALLRVGDNTNDIPVNQGASNIFYGTWNNFKVTLYTTGWTESMLYPLSNFTEINFSLFMDAYFQYTTNKDIEFRTKNGIIEYNGGNSAKVFIEALAGHVYKISFDDVTVFDNVAVKLGIIVKYSNQAEIVTLYNNNASNAGSVSQTYAFKLSTEYGNVEYLELAARVASGKQLTYNITDITDNDNDRIDIPLTNTLYKIASIEKNGTGQAVIALLGDSWTHSEKPGTTTYEHTNYVQPLTKYLRSTYGNAGGGYYSFSCSHNGTAKMGCADPDDANDTRGGSITYQDQVSGCKGIDAADATFGTSSWLELNILTAHDKLVIHYYGSSSAGKFTYTLDNGSPVLVDASSTEGHQTITLNTTDATHTLRFDVTDGNVMLFGVDMQRTASGVRVHKIGNKGATTESYVIVDTECWTSIFSSLNIDSATILLGVNDGSSLLAIVRDRLLSIIGNMRAANSYVDITIISPSNTKNMNMTAQALFQMLAAEEAKAGYISLIPLFGSSQKIIGKGMFFDNLHPTTTGGRMIADHLIKEFGL
jgi:hypothetical protein